jgi:AcrR family transcriptional regulator
VFVGRRLDPLDQVAVDDDSFDVPEDGLTPGVIRQGDIGHRDEPAAAEKPRQGIDARQGVQMSGHKIGPDLELHPVQSGSDSTSWVAARPDHLDDVNVIGRDAVLRQLDAMPVFKALEHSVTKLIFRRLVELVAHAPRIELEPTEDAAVGGVRDDILFHGDRLMVSAVREEDRSPRSVGPSLDRPTDLRLLELSDLRYQEYRKTYAPVGSVISGCDRGSTCQARGQDATCGSTGTLSIVIDHKAPTPEASVASRRRPGRPRRPSTDETILRATLELLQLGVPNEVTIDAIVARSGSAKTTIYRRWPSLESLIVDSLRVAVRARLDQVEEIQEFDELHGSPVRGAARQILSLVKEPLFQTSFPMMARILLGDPALGDRFRREVFAPLRTVRRAELLSMWAKGDVREGVDPDLVFDLVNGAILYRALMGQRLDEEIADEIADMVSRSFEIDASTPPSP